MVITNCDKIPDVKLIIPQKFGDDRGYFSETYKKSALEESGIFIDFIQDNESLSTQTGTVRGLHFQLPPFDQAKLVRVLSGEILDIAVDIRPHSPTYGDHIALKLNAEDGRQLLIPAGFAHGFCTLTDHVKISYKVSAPYSKAHEGGILWNDPDLAIHWPVSKSEFILSEKDKLLPHFKALHELFNKNFGGPPTSHCGVKK